MAHLWIWISNSGKLFIKVEQMQLVLYENGFSLEARTAATRSDSEIRRQSGSLWRHSQYGAKKMISTRYGLDIMDSI